MYCTNRGFKCADKFCAKKFSVIAGTIYENNKVGLRTFFAALYLISSSEDEQKRFCAYTDEYIRRTDAGDIEHFNPSLKDAPSDNYYNWFLVKHLWNKEKGHKWEDFQPILHPTADVFEDRIIYFDGDYLPKSNSDTEAINLIRLLKLDDPGLAENRKKYIKRKRADIHAFGQDHLTFFKTLIDDDVCCVSYLRAIKEEFGVDIWEMLS